jgi:Fe-S-cluster containining protein
MNPRLREAHGAFDVEVTRIVRAGRAQGLSIPCRTGCDACCYDVAWCLPEEARELAERVRSWPRRRREAITLRLLVWFAEMRADGLDPENPLPNLRRYHRRRRACPLLDTAAGRCSAYELRPLSCRGHYVIAPDALGCANRAKEPEVTAITVDEPIARAVVRIGTVRPTERLLPVALAEALGVEEVPSCVVPPLPS